MNCNKGIKQKNPVLIIVLDFSTFLFRKLLNNLKRAILIKGFD